MIEHHVVGHIDQIADGPLSGQAQAALHPVRRRPNLHVAHDGRRETAAQIGIENLDLHAVSHIRAGAVADSYAGCFNGCPVNAATSRATPRIDAARAMLGRIEISSTASPR